jgi:hypothetical protein
MRGILSEDSKKYKIMPRAMVIPPYRIPTKNFENQ